MSFGDTDVDPWVEELRINFSSHEGEGVDHGKCGAKIVELVCAMERKEGVKQKGETREGDFDRLRR
jgi:hypothetical protein